MVNREAIKEFLCNVAGLIIIAILVVCGGVVVLFLLPAAVSFIFSSLGSGWVVGGDVFAFLAAWIAGLWQ